MRIIQVDSKNKEIKYINIPDDEDGCYKAISKLIGGHFSAPYMFPNGDILYAWDDNVTKIPDEGFFFSVSHQLYYPGSAVIVGTEGSQEISTKTDIEMIKRMIFFR